MENPCYIFDIDGTIADLSHRLHHIQKMPKDWRAFFASCEDDEPIHHMCDLARLLALEVPVVFVSGRSDEIRDQTVDWLKEQRLWGGYLYMRKEGDHRPDNLVTAELLAELRADGWEPVMAFDDRDQVVNMWRENGIPCAQVAEGNF